MIGAMEETHASGFGRMLLASFGLHLAAGAFLASGSWFAPKPYFPGERIIEVKMVSLAPETPKAAPRPAPPKPPPPPPPEEKVLIPEQARPIQEKKREPKPEPPPREPPPQQEVEPEYDLGSALDALRDEMGEPEPEADAEPVDGEPAVAATGANRVADRELVRWVSQVKRRVRGAWVLAPGFQGQPLYTEVEVRLSARGQVTDVEVTRRSGNPWYDESVVRALQSASPLPAPPEAGTWPFSFSPEDAR